VNAQAIQDIGEARRVFLDDVDLHDARIADMPCRIRSVHYVVIDQRSASEVVVVTVHDEFHGYTSIDAAVSRVPMAA